MNAHTIAARIGGSIEAGELRPRPPAIQFDRPLTMADLIRPYGAVFPGAKMMPDGEDVVDIFGWGPGCLRRPGNMVPSPRRSSRPLPPPRSTPPPIRLISPGIFFSVAGVWEWYQQKGLASPELLERPYDSQGVTAFIEPLEHEVSDYYPLGIFLEQIGWDPGVPDLTGIPLLLPHFSYEEECAGVVEAFLSGAESVASILTELHDRENLLDLPKEDRALIQEHGFVKIVQCYADYRGKKSCDIPRLHNFNENFFGNLWKRFPEWERADLPIITGSAGDDCEIVIKGPDTIEFCLAYAEAYESMMAAMPYPYDFEFNEDRATDKFIHEVCTVWRKVHKLPSIPLGASLANVFKSIDLEGEHDIAI